MKRWTMVILVIVAAALLAPASSAPTTSRGTYLVFVDDNVAATSSGDTVEVALEDGIFNGATREASGEGAWTSDALGSGTFTLERLVAFQFYGCGFMGDPTLCGGRAVFAVHLSGSAELDGLLEVNCQIGSPPPGTSEGTKLNVGSGFNFHRHVSGENVFVAL